MTAFKLAYVLGDVDPSEPLELAFLPRHHCLGQYLVDTEQKSCLGHNRFRKKN